MRFWQTIVTLLILIFLALGGIALYRMHKTQEEFKQYLETKIIALQEQPVKKEVVERVIAPVEAWSDLQARVKNTVVQVFAQVAAVDLLEPFRTPDQRQGAGSGFFINGDGEIITNAHVVDQAKSVWIQIPSFGKYQFDVDVVGVTPDRDIALLKIRPDGLEKIKGLLGDVPFLALGDSDFVRRGDEIMTLGYPLGQQSLKSTVGVVSGRESHLIQIDAPINPGNSGGPSVNRLGQVIGINTLGAVNAQNVGYIVPVNELKLVVDDLRKVSLLKKPFLGLLFNSGSEALTTYLGNPLPGGLYIVDVYKGSPLSKAGIQKGDMLYAINGHDVDVYGELLWQEDKISVVDYVSQLKLGQPLNLTIYRKGQRKEIAVNFEHTEMLPIRRIYPGYEVIDYEIVAGMVVQSLTLNHLGLLVGLAPSLAKYAEMQYQTEPALVITHIFPDSQAQRSRALLPGCILKEVNGEKVKTLDEFRTALFKGVDTGTLSIETSEGVFFVCPIEKIVREDQKLANNYFFNLSETMKTMAARVNATQEKGMLLAESKPASDTNSDQAIAA